MLLAAIKNLDMLCNTMYACVRSLPTTVCLYQSCATSYTLYICITGCCLIVGGAKNTRAQEAELRAKPDIIVCTPGRMIDHLTNSACVHLEDLEILVLDEVNFNYLHFDYRSFYCLHAKTCISLLLIACLTV
jgi:DEAD/DEAH box helicase